ncbi:MAG: ACP phosphodiesterase [Bacteroidales bacterium]|jgi:acyl carrier protein phosphodiesterase|nr:ACP phosphodiesterase [Bacteroidales bacterium]HOI33280.1 ACP phosphodiesterase [Bacteroidales bacterium]
MTIFAEKGAYNLNFLAHAFLSGPDHQVLIGNFVADSIKGKMIERYNDGVKKGVILHRAIDAYTDQHEVVKNSVARLQPAFRRFSPVIADIYYDHFLAVHWKDYGSTELSEFSAKVYKILIRNFSKLPPRSKRILPWMIAQNWLTGYANLHDLQRVFKGMSHRTSFDSGMENAVDFLRKNYQDFEDDFKLFFPDLMSKSDEVLKGLDAGSSGE